MTDSATLWQQLQLAGLVTGELPATQAEQQPAFFLRMLLGVSGWLSAIFFTAFISAAFISVASTTSTIWMIGVILCALSIGISRITHLPILAGQFVFACSLAGQAQIIFGVSLFGLTAYVVKFQEYYFLKDMAISTISKIRRK